LPFWLAICTKLSHETANLGPGNDVGRSHNHGALFEIHILTDDSSRSDSAKGECVMLWTIFVLLIIMWVLGVITGYTIAGFIHILLVLAIGMVLIRIIQGRNPL
jgi:hypothetical protein